MTEDDDPPEDFTGPYAADAPHHDEWRRARAWAADVYNLAGDLPYLARTGITRAIGRRLGQLVFSIEAAIRRLVLHLALTLTPTLAETKLKHPRVAPQRAAPAPAAIESPKPIRVRFRFFALRGTGRRRPPPASATAPARGPVFTFARDPLLAIDPAPAIAKAHPRRSSLRSRENPHARAFRHMMHGRARHADDMNDLSSGFFSRPEQRPCGSRNPPMLRQDRPVRETHGLPHDQLIPAPSLACRIAALVNVINDPMAFAARAAQRLARLAGGIETLRNAPEPKPPTIKGDNREAPALNLLWRCHGLFAGLNDSS